MLFQLPCAAVAVRLGLSVHGSQQQIQDPVRIQLLLTCPVMRLQPSQCNERPGGVHQVATMRRRLAMRG